MSCIYGLGSKENYGSMHVRLENGMKLVRDDLLRRLVEILYTGTTRLPPGHLSRPW